MNHENHFPLKRKLEDHFKTLDPGIRSTFIITFQRIIEVVGEARVSCFDVVVDCGEL